MSKENNKELNNSENNHVKTVGMIMIIVLLGKTLGLVRDLLITYNYGLDGIGAAFNTASLVPRKFLDIIFASAISASFIPVFNQYLMKKGKEEAYDLANYFISLILVLSVIVTVLGVVFAEPIASTMNSSIEGEYFILTIDLLRIMMPLIILSGIAFSLTGILQSLGEFNIPAAMSTFSNVLIILYFFTLGEKFGIYGLAVVFLLSWILQVVIQFPFLIKNNYKYKFKLSIKHKGIREIIKLMIPVMIGTWAQPINVLVNTGFANSVHSSWGTALVSADNLFTIITGVFILSVTNVIFPKLSQELALDNKENFTSIMNNTLRGLIYLLLPMAGGLLILSDPLVRILYERGATTPEAASLIVKSLRFYLVGIIGMGVQTVASRGLYACKDGKTPLITGIVAILINAICSFIFLPYLGVGGPALASSVSMTIVAVIMIIILNNKNKGVLTKKAIVDIIKMLVSTVIMMCPVYFVFNFLSGIYTNIVWKIICISVAVLIGVFVYFVTTWYFNISESKKAIEIIRKMIGKFTKD